ncbi:flavoprotein, partial [Candidatus Allofournierella excrementavium]
AKLAAGISDTPVTLGAKSMLRGAKPLVLAVSTNDGLAASMENLARLINRKNFYLVPFAQDDWLKKPASLQSDYSLIGDTLECAMRGRQLQPVLTE